ncbi:MAG TPA: hypothetical protein VE422_30480 [Terriglobia bacterium]|nr:hypothetical protein [Terriglobia bacterium]
MDHNKNEWEEIKEGARALKNAAGLVFGALFWGFMMLTGIWAFLEAIFQITLTFSQAILVSVGIGLVFIMKSWLSHRQPKKNLPN